MNTIGFYEQPKNGDQITRARTTSQIRSWDMPRSQKALEKFNQEICQAEFPGLYILFAKNRVYVGEAKSLYDRLKTHTTSPEDKIKDWIRVIVINDGRPASQSDFNDTVVRRALEIYLVRLFKANKYSVVSQGESQTPNAQQKYAIDSLKNELEFFLKKKNLITKLLDERGQEEVFGDELKKIIEKAGLKASHWTAYEVEIEGQKAYIRPGSKKPGAGKSLREDESPAAS